MKKSSKSSTGKKFQGIRPAKSVTTPRSIKPVVISFVKKTKKS